MKLKIKNRLTAKAGKRFKWMCITCISILAFQYVFQGQMESIQNSIFVDAGEDYTFEKDDVYSTYIKSAQLQKDLMIKQKREGKQTWTMENYQKFKARRMQSLYVLLDMQQNVWSGKKGWEKEVKDFDKLYKDIKPSRVKVGDKMMYKFKSESFTNYTYQLEAQGYVEEYWSHERCYSGMINTPGVTLLPNTMMGILYLIFLCYLFLGISISADIFMEAIDVITAEVSTITIKDNETGKEYLVEVPIWNPTMANLTLMAFGSSAPEIILSVLEALKSLGEPAGALGPFSIVGSGAFNLLIISAVSIAAVGGETGEVKWIDDMGVFICTGFFSIFAYVWMFLCLSVNSPDQVTVKEAVWTCTFFFILLVLAFGCDKYNQKKKEAQKAKQDKETRDKENIIKMNRARLRSFCKQKGVEAVLSAAQGQKHSKMSDQDIALVKEWYCEILETKDLTKYSLETFNNVLKPDSMFERFAARKAVGAANTKEFLEIKGQKFQMENEPTAQVIEANERIGFKCLHYSVTESAGHVEVTIVKNQKYAMEEMVFGVKTSDGTAKGGENELNEKGGMDYEPLEKVIQMAKSDTEKVVSIKIIDNEEWQPDTNFFITLYDENFSEQLSGDDTQCKITILDEDFPGKLGFDKTEIVASQSHQDQVDIIIHRIDGNHGTISCAIRTEPFLPNDLKDPHNAKEHQDYKPKEERVTFLPGENQKIVPIYLVDEQVPEIDADGKIVGTKVDPINKDDDGSEDEDEEDDFAPKFKVIIDKPEPREAVKISKKNCVTVELKRSGKVEDSSNEHTKMIQYFVEQKNPSWSYQFKKAVMLCPQIDEDDLIVEDVSIGEALFHFLNIGWNVVFAFIPPVEWGGGKPAFIIALAMIGTITAVVAEVATVLGCTLGLKQAVTAITLVAIGTSLPDTFASQTAALNSEFADSAIGNVTGSNSVNVFVGLGLPWIISSIYQSKKGEKYVTPAGDLAFSVMLFLITSVLCFMVLGVRRYALGGELGGPKGSRYFSAFLCVSLWVIYTTFSTLKAYNVINGF